MDAFKNHLIAWLPLVMAVLSWLIVRYGKTDTKMPYHIPERLRPWVPIGASILASAIEKFVVPGATWSDALRTALIGGLTPILAHDLITESAMNGREIPVPGMVKSSTPPMLPLLAFAAATFLGGLLLFTACTPGQKQAARTALDVASYACIIENAALGDATVAEACQIEQALVPAMKELLKAHRVALHRVAAPAPCGSTSSSAPASSAQ